MSTRHCLGPVFAFALLWGSSTSAQSIRADLWSTNGIVTSLAPVGNTLYFAGSFSRIGPAPGGGVPLDPIAGTPRRPYPRVAGIVRAVVSDGRGGWFLGGDFSGVEGVPRSNLAHVLADGSVATREPPVDDNSFPPRLSDPLGTGTVMALALHGHTLFVGGNFIRMGGRDRSHLAAIDVRTGEILGLDPAPTGAVTALAIRGNTLFVGGGFDHIGGVERHAIAALDLPSGRVNRWNPSADGSVRAIACQGRTIIVGGEFDHVGDAARNSIAALDLDTGKATSWDARLQPVRQLLPHGGRIWPFIAGVELRGSTIYATGQFDSIGGRAQQVVAALDLRSGAATGFDAHAGGGYGKALKFTGSTLALGGYFYSFGDSVRPNIAELDPSTGVATRWNPRADGLIHTLDFDGSTVFAGGDILLMHDWVDRHGLAAVDIGTGMPREWSPTLDGYGIVSDMITAGNTLYISGDFTHVDGTPRGHLAAFDGATGELTGWNPWDQQVTPASFQTHSTFPINRMARIGNTIYVGGKFDQIDGVARRHAAAIDATTGLILPWDADLSNEWVSAIAGRGDTVLIGGSFTSAGGEARWNVAALDGTSGAVTPWNPAGPWPPAPFDFVAIYAFASTEDGVFIGGWYLTARGQPRMALAEFDAAGNLLPFDARIDASDVWLVGWQPAVRALVPFGDRLVVGGRFDQIGGREIKNLAIIDPRTGLADDWNPAAYWTPGYQIGVETLARAGDTLFVGGAFGRIGSFPSGGLAMVVMSSGRTRPAEALATRGVSLVPFALEPPIPNPSRSSTELKFAIPATCPVTLEVFDLAGRRISAPVDHEVLRAGPQVVALETRGWQSGVYYCRLTAGGRSATRKLVVIQ